MLLLLLPASPRIIDSLVAAAPGGTISHCADIMRLSRRKVNGQIAQKKARKTLKRQDKIYKREARQCAGPPEPEACYRAFSGNISFTGRKGERTTGIRGMAPSRRKISR